MIRKGKASDQKAVYRLWKELFAFDDGGYSDYYFDALYDEKDLLVKEAAGEVAACLQRRRHQMVINGRTIDTSIIVGVMTHPAYRHRGYMRELMEQTLKDAAKQELLTVIQAYDMNLYTPFGFRAVNGKAEHVYAKSGDTFQIDLQEGYDAKSMAACFWESMASYSGYFVRDEAYFLRYEQEMKAQGLKCVRYMENKRCMAYAIYERGTDGIVCSEWMAVDAVAHEKLLKALRTQDQVTLILPIEYCEGGDPCDNTLILVHDEAGLCARCAISMEEVSEWKCNGKTWYLPEWA